MEDGIDIFKSSFGCAFNDSRFSDTTVVCGDHVFHVHKVILCSHSPVFMKVFSGDWKESSESKYTIDEESPPVVEAMLYFMYNFEYNSGSLAEARSTPMVFHAQMYAIADLYNIKALKEYSKTKFRVAVNHDPHWPTDNFSLAVVEVYTSTPDTDRELRDFVLDVVQSDLSNLTPLESFQQALNDAPGFAVDMCRTLADRVKNQSERLVALTDKSVMLSQQLHDTDASLAKERAKTFSVKGTWYQVHCQSRVQHCVNEVYHIYSKDGSADRFTTTCKTCGWAGQALEPLSSENLGRTENLLSEGSPITPTTPIGWGFGAPTSFYEPSRQRPL